MRSDASVRPEYAEEYGGGAPLAKHLLVLVLCMAAVFAVYGNVLGHDFLINWDDNRYVTDNPAVRGVSLANLKRAFSSFYVGNYAPLQIVSYMFDYTLWGLRPAGYLLTNLLSHGINGFLLYLLVMRLRGKLPVAVGAALLFLLHPAQVETVAWISQRKNLLSLTFFLLGALAYVMFREDSGRKKRFYWLSIASFAAALLTKSAAVIFPVMLLFYDIWYAERPLLRSLPDKLPFAVIALAAAGLTLLTQSAEYGGGGRTSFHGGSAYATLLTMLPVFVSYIRMVFWPAGLSAAYAPDIKKTVDPEVAGSAVVLVLVIWYAVYLFRKDRRVFFWLSLFPLGLLPVAQIFPLITLMNDRYLYYPMVGMAPFLALGVIRFAQGTSLLMRRFTCLAAVAALLALAVAANQRVAVWRNAVTLWSDAVAKVPASSYAHYFLAEAYFKTGRYDEARRILLETTGKFPGMAAAHELLGNLFYETGDLNSAEEYYRKALAIRSDLPIANLCLGNIHLSRKEYESARERFLQAEKMKPDSPDIAYSLACAESMLGRSEFALAYLEKAFAKGFAGCQAVRVNHELDPLRRSPAYTRIIKGYCGGSDGT